MIDQKEQPDLLRWEPGMELSTEEEYHAATAWLAKELLRDNTPEQIAIIAAQHVIFADAIMARPKELEARPEVLKHSSDIPRGLSRSTNEQLRREALAKEELAREVLAKFGAQCSKMVLDAWQAKTTRKRMTGLVLISDSKGEARNRALEISTSIWLADTTEVTRIRIVGQKVWNQLIDDGLKDALPDNMEAMMDWIRPAAPHGASRPGRDKKGRKKK